MCGDKTPDKFWCKVFGLSVSIVASLALLVGTISVYISAVNDSTRFGRCVEGPDASKYLPSTIFKSQDDHLMRGSQCTIPIAVYLCLDDNVDFKKWASEPTSTSTDVKCERYEVDARIASRGCTSAEWQNKGEVPNRQWNCFYFRGSGTVGKTRSGGPDYSTSGPANIGWLVLAVVLTCATCAAFMFSGMISAVEVVDLPCFFGPLVEDEQRAVFGTCLAFLTLILSATVVVMKFALDLTEKQSDKPDLANIIFLTLISILCVIGLLLGGITIEHIRQSGAGFSCRLCAKMPAKSSMPITPTPGTSPTTAEP